MNFEIIRNDITSMKVDAVVLPANSRLKEGSGTSAAIFEKAGRNELERACRKIGKVNIGDSVPTLGYNLEAKFILHTVVPKWKNGKQQEYELLSASYLSALCLADEMGCATIAFPLLAAGNNGFDLELAYRIAKESIESYEAKHKLTKVYLVVYEREVMSMLRNLGITAEELIDEVYILEKDEEYKLPAKRVLEEGKDIAQKFVDDGMKMALKYLENPNHRKKILEKGANIAALVIAITKKKK